MGSATGGGSLVTVKGTLGGAVVSGIVTKGCVFFIWTGVAGLASGRIGSPTRAVSFFGPGEMGGVGRREVGAGAGGAAAGLGGGRVGKLIRTGWRDSLPAPGDFVSGRGGAVMRTGSFFGSFGSAMRF